ncbi:MAG: mandelate racemase/muconate lactonizing enzyme family protein [Nitrospinota bacterium]
MAPSPLTLLMATPVHVRVPLPRPLAVSTFRLPAVDTCAVTLRTREGLKGIGWCFAFGPERARALMAMVRDLFGVIAGKDPRDAEATWEAMRRSASFVGREGLSAMAIGALDTACWDIAAQAAGQPLWKLLGGERREIPCYASEGLWLNATRDELQWEAASLKARGFRAMKLRVGKPSLEEDLERVRAVREAVGGEFPLMADANQGWSLEAARRACLELEPHRLVWIEEPVDHEDIPGMAALVKESAADICTGETNYGPPGLRRILEAGAADVLMADLERCAGVTGWLRAARLAEAFGKPITPHLFHEVSAHLMSACPGAVWCEHMPWWEPILKEPLPVKEGFLVLSDKPGLGIEWDEAALRRFAPPAGG